MDDKQIQGELIKISAELVLCRHLPPEYVDDYPQKTYSAARVARMMEKAHDHSKGLAIRLRKVADSMNA